MKTKISTTRAGAIVMASLCCLLVTGVQAGPPLQPELPPPAYPTDADPAYATLVATLPGFGLLPPFPEGYSQRCSTNGEAEIAIVGFAFNAAGNAEFACEALPPLGPKEACFAALTVIAIANEADSIVAAQCGFQDALIDGTEIAAILADSSVIHSDLGLHDDRLITHDEEVQAKLDTVIARQLEVVRLLHTPNGQRSTDIPACNGQPCTWNPR